MPNFRTWFWREVRLFWTRNSQNVWQIQGFWFRAVYQKMKKQSIVRKAACIQGTKRQIVDVKTCYLSQVEATTSRAHKTSSICKGKKMLTLFNKLPKFFSIEANTYAFFSFYSTSVRLTWLMHAPVKSMNQCEGLSFRVLSEWVRKVCMSLPLFLT